MRDKKHKKSERGEDIKKGEKDVCMFDIKTEVIVNGS